MTTATLQKIEKDIESFVKAGRRKLLEFEVFRSKWEVQHGQGKTYKTAKSFMRDIRSKLK